MSPKSREDKRRLFFHFSLPTFAKIVACFSIFSLQTFAKTVACFSIFSLQSFADIVACCMNRQVSCKS